MDFPYNFIAKGVQIWQDNNTPRRKNLNLFLKQFEANEIAAENNIHPNMLSKWKREAESQLYTLFQDNLSKERKAQKAHESEINDLYAQIGKLTTQNEWLKKKSGF